MVHDPRRAALIACCVVSILVAAALFPAAGYGDYPDFEAVENDHYATDGDSNLPSPDSGEGNGTEDGDGDDTGENADESDNSSTDTGDSDPGAETPTETDAPNETETETDENTTGTAPGTDGPGDDDDSVLGFLPILLIGGVCAVGLWRVTDPTREAGVSTGDLPSGFVSRLRLRFRRIPQLAMGATITVSRVVPSILDGVSSTARGVGAGVSLLTRDVGRGLSTAMITLPAAMAGAGRGLFSISGGFSSLFDWVLSGSRRSRSPSEIGSTTATASTQSESADDPDLGPRTVEEAWAEMVETLPVRRHRTRTPGEFARAALTTDLPERPVSTLTDAFRDVRYGGLPPSPDRTRRAREAFSAIERARVGADAGDERDGTENGDPATGTESRRSDGAGGDDA